MKSFLKDLVSKDKKLQGILCNIDFAIDNLTRFEINDSAVREAVDELIENVNKMFDYFNLKSLRIDIKPFYKTQRVFVEEDDKGLHLTSLDTLNETVINNDKKDLRIISIDVARK